VLALIVGWVLYIGRTVFVPIVLGVITAYVVVGLAQLLERTPFIRSLLPSRLRIALSLLLIGTALYFAVGMLVLDTDRLVALAPRFQDSMLALIRKGATLLHIESEPTWDSLRRDILAQLNIQAMMTGMLASLSSIIANVFVVALYASFLLAELSTFNTKLENITANAANAARVKIVIANINTRIGTYLAMKAVLGVLLGALCYVTMRVLGLEFAELWATLIVIFNYVPYVGTVLGVALPTLMSMLQFGQLSDVLLMLALLAVLHFVIGNMLDPYMMGSSLNLSPFAILVSLAIWSSIWGIPGAFLAIPITVSMTIIFSEFEVTRPIAILLSKSGRISYSLNPPVN